MDIMEIDRQITLWADLAHEIDFLTRIVNESPELVEDQLRLIRSIAQKNINQTAACHNIVYLEKV